MVLREVQPLPRPSGGGLAMFRCLEDEEHTARCIVAIRARKRREDRAVLIDVRTGMGR